MLKLLLLAAAAAGISAATAVSSEKIKRERKLAQLKALHVPEQAVSLCDEPTADEYGMDYMYV